MNINSPHPDKSMPDRANYAEGGDTQERKEEAYSSASAKSQKRKKRSDPTLLVEQILGTTRGVASVVSSEARNITGQISQELGASAEAGVEKGADSLSGLVKAMQIAGRELQGDSPALARNIDAAAAHLENFADSIRGRSVTDMFSSASDLARRNPTTFLAGAIIAGFAASRFLRSSHAAESEDPGTVGDRADTPISAG